MHKQDNSRSEVSEIIWIYCYNNSTLSTFKLFNLFALNTLLAIYRFCWLVLWNWFSAKGRDITFFARISQLKYLQNQFNYWENLFKNLINPRIPVRIKKTPSSVDTKDQRFLVQPRQRTSDRQIETRGSSSFSTRLVTLKEHTSRH